jgi:Mg2+/Co2+ transporter CorB
VLTRFVRLFRPRVTTSDGAHDDIMDAITTGHSAGGVETEHRNRLLGALDLHQRTVEEIMRHRREIEMIDADDSPDEVVAQVLASRYTRLPVFRDGTENILGVLHAKDLLREVHRLLRGEAGSIAGLDVARVAMKPYFIPETTSLDDQMREFLQRRTHFALVVDEYGGLQGLITLEDILEEIVGEIRDEFDKGEREPQLLPGPAGDYLIDGAMTIRDLNRAMDWALPDDEANTLAGLVIHESQTIPNEGQVFRFHGFRFEVIERRENRLTRLRIKPLQA